MIVQPDFLDHWKTTRLVELTGEPTAPLAVLRLWAHCQQRKAWRFENMGPDVLKAICRWPNDAKKFYDAMKKSGFIVTKDKKLTVHDWSEVNASLITSWENGRKHKGNRTTGGIPADNRRDIQSVSDKTDKTDQIDERREDKTDQTDQTDQTEGSRGEGLDGEDPPPPVSGSDVLKAGEMLSSFSGLESVRFLCGGKKTKPATKTLESLVGRLPEDEVKKACAYVYALKLDGRLRKDPAALLTSMLTKAASAPPDTVSAAEILNGVAAIPR